MKEKEFKWKEKQLLTLLIVLLLYQILFPTTPPKILKNIKKLGVVYLFKLHISLSALFFPSVKDEKI